MNYRSTLLTASAAVLFAGLANAQAPYSHNWAHLAGGPPALLLDPAFYGGETALGDSIRLCYSIDATQGGRAEAGASVISYFDVAQAFGGNNTTLGVDIGQVMIGSRVSDDLTDDSCMSDIFITTGTPYSTNDLLLGAPGLIAGTGGYSINQGFFWDIAFNFIGTTVAAMPTLGNTAGVDLANPFGGPLLTHLVYEIQGPLAVDGVVNNQYWLASTAELNGPNVAAPGGVTNGLAAFASGTYGVDPVTSAAVTGNRVTIADSTPALTGAGPIGVLGGVGNEVEFLGGIAFAQPVLNGRNNGNMGNGGGDWVISGGNLSTIDVQVTDKLSGGELLGSGAAIEDPTVLFEFGFLLWSSTPEVSMTQLPMSWDGLGGGAPPKAGSYLLPPLGTLRAGTQTVHVNLDATLSAFLSSSLSVLSPFTPAFDPGFDANGVNDLFDFPGTTAGASTFAGGAIPLGAPSAGAAGLRLGLHALVVQVNALLGLSYAEMSNAKTLVLQ